MFLMHLGELTSKFCAGPAPSHQMAYECLSVSQVIIRMHLWLFHMSFNPVDIKLLSCKISRKCHTGKKNQVMYKEGKQAPLNQNTV